MIKTNNHVTNKQKENNKNINSHFLVVKIDSTTSRVTSASNPKDHVTIKTLNPCMLLVD